MRFYLPLFCHETNNMSLFQELLHPARNRQEKRPLYRYHPCFPQLFGALQPHLQGAEYRESRLHTRR